MTSAPDVDRMAEAIEHARFDQLRQGTWDVLRESERTTRVTILRDAMVASGVAGEIDAVRSQADRTSHLLELLSQRDREASTDLAAHDAEIVRLADQVAALRSQLGTLGDALAQAEERAERAEVTVLAVREAVAPRVVSQASRR